MKSFDRTKFKSSRRPRPIYWLRQNLLLTPKLINSLAILFVLILGLNSPHPILDYTNFTPETKTFAKKEETKITLKTPRLALQSPQKISQNSPTKIAESTTTKPATGTPRSSAQKTSATSSSKNYITLSGRNIEIFRSGNTNINAGARVGLYGRGFLYGHNSAAVFGSLGSIQTFSVTLDGVTKNYAVVNRVTLPKTCTSSSECAEKYMGALTSNQSYRGKHYNLVLMTCAGTPIGSADATHRLIVFANEI